MEGSQPLVTDTEELMWHKEFMTTQDFVLGVSDVFGFVLDHLH